MNDLTLVRRKYDAVLYLVACALDGSAPDARVVSSLDLDAVFAEATRHNVEAMVAHALERVGKATPAMSDAKIKSIRRVMLFDRARSEIFVALEQAGIKYMPLKGVILKDLYPYVGLRQMTDNDILFSPDRRGDVKRIMTGLGYRVEEYCRSNQDVYMKEPVYNFEMHVALYGSGTHKRYADYFENILDRAEVMEGTEWGRRLSTVDFYLHLKSHEHKHYAGGGTGLRSLCDTYVFTEKKGEELEGEALRAGLSALGLTEFDRATRELSKGIFSPENRAALAATVTGGEDYLTAEQRAMLDYYATSGTYGVLDNFVEHDFVTYSGGRVTLGKKIGYVMRRIFPPVEFYKEAAPLVYRHRILIPGYCLIRFLRAVFTKPLQLIKQLRLLSRVDKKNGK